jgi:hypothetical protein
MFGGELLVSLALRERLGRLDETAAAVGIFVEIHVPSLGLFRRPRAGRDLAETWPTVMPALGAGIPPSQALLCHFDRDGRNKSGHDERDPAVQPRLTCSNRGAAGTSSLGLQGGAGASVT